MLSKAFFAANYQRINEHQISPRPVGGYSQMRLRADFLACKPRLTPLDTRHFHRYAYLITKLTKSCSDKILERLGPNARVERCENYCLRMPDTGQFAAT